MSAHPDERVRIFGIRHHGPGSARALKRALEDFKPDAVLIEGPPEADPIVPLAADPGMVAPVALLAHVPAGGPATGPADGTADDRPADGTANGGDGRRAAFWPFAEFSPEWQAIRYAAAAGVPVRFCDLPAAHQLAEPEPEPEPGPGPTPEHEDGGGPGGGDGEGDADGSAAAPEEVRLDPLGRLAAAAGYDDAERWWDDVIEHRDGGPPPFEAIAEAMTALREHAPVMPEAYTRREERREAYMRRTLRRTLKDGFERVAVVCGAWHVPALAARVPAAHDDRTLRGLPRVRVAVTWVPWTHGRLAGRSGYGAGVRSPGWYHHLFSVPDRPIERWLTKAARVLRDEDLPVSSAHVIEAVRLATTLAALRDRPLAGLDEVTEATRAVLCEGAELPLELIQRRMVVGESLGAVPDSTPMVPLQRDLRGEQRRLSLKPAAQPKEHDLDLRKPKDRDRSRLLHRLRLLDVGWGVPGESGRGKGTFREAWTLRWRPEFDVELIEASVWGTSVHGAAAAKAEALAATAEHLPELTGLAERCLLADLGGALPAVMGTLADRAAADTDVAHLMAALPALVRALRYGDVRGTPTGPLRTVVDGLVVRICVGLPPAVSGLDDDAARALLARLDEVHGALALLDDGGHLGRWQDTLSVLVDRAARPAPHGLHGLIEGRLTRLLSDAGRLGDVADRMARAVSAGESPARAAAWIEGFLAGGGLILIHDDALLRLVDGWIAGLPAESFTDVLPLLRRTFAEYEAPERRSVGERVRRLGGARDRAAASSDPGSGNGLDAIDAARAAPAVRTVTTILGWPDPAGSAPAGIPAEGDR